MYNCQVTFIILIVNDNFQVPQGNFKWGHVLVRCVIDVKFSKAPCTFVQCVYNFKFGFTFS